MSLAKKLDSLYTYFIATTQAKAIAESVACDADVLSKRETVLRQADARKNNINDSLLQSKRYMDNIRFVEELAKKDGIHVEEALKRLPEDLVQLYLTAKENVQPQLDELKRLEGRLEVSIVAASFDDQLQLYIPVRWEERQQASLPGLLYTAAIVAAVNTARATGEELSEPKDFEGIARVLISEKNGADVVRVFTENLCSSDVQEIRDARVDVYIDKVVTECRISRMRRYDSGEYTQSSRKSGKSTPASKTGDYTSEEAAEIWRNHDVRNGTVNGSPMNYLLKLSRRASEGRLIEEPDGSVSQDSLDDFIQYADTRKEIARLKSGRIRQVSIDAAAKILGVNTGEVRQYIGEGLLTADRHDLISVNSMSVNLTKKHMYRGGKWIHFK